jgi:N utilization substance protein B
LHIRRKARRIALQALYEIDCSSHPVDAVLERRLIDNELDDATESYLRELVNGVLSHRQQLDLVIHQHAPEWPIDQMAIIDRNILRIAIYELVGLNSTPLKVAINEAVELAKHFGSDSASRFVNGVLGTLAAKHNELIATYEMADNT